MTCVVYNTWSKCQPCLAQTSHRSFWHNAFIWDIWFLGDKRQRLPGITAANNLRLFRVGRWSDDHNTNFYLSQTVPWSLVQELWDMYCTVTQDDTKNEVYSLCINIWRGMFKYKSESEVFRMGNMMRYFNAQKLWVTRLRYSGGETGYLRYDDVNPDHVQTDPRLRDESPSVHFLISPNIYAKLKGC